MGVGGAAQLINAMGQCSAIDRGSPDGMGRTLSPSSTSSARPMPRLHLAQEPEAAVAVGLLKIGYKSLFHFDGNGAPGRPLQLSVLDFYVHEAWQRGGYGRLHPSP